MADIVKWLRPRIVVPIYVGSNPTIRPIFLSPPLSRAFLKFWRYIMLKANHRQYFPEGGGGIYLIKAIREVHTWELI